MFQSCSTHNMELTAINCPGSTLSGCFQKQTQGSTIVFTLDYSNTRQIPLFKGSKTNLMWTLSPQVERCCRNIFIFIGKFWKFFKKLLSKQTGLVMLPRELLADNHGFVCSCFYTALFHQRTAKVCFLPCTFPRTCRHLVRESRTKHRHFLVVNAIEKHAVRKMTGFKEVGTGPETTRGKTHMQQPQLSDNYINDMP